MNIKNFINVLPEVALAISSGRPVVALESTIIAHGMPYPENIQTALEVEAIIRENGAIPATIAILNGELCVGLDEKGLEILGRSENVWKVSLRDMPYVISKKMHGATTVASTMRIASLAGINVFVTGGIGGVHRGAEKSMDVSADLFEMSHTNVAVVSAGVKSILDIGLTLEYLETMGVPVVTVGQNEFPAFYSRESGFKSPLRIDEPAEIAEMIRVKWEMGLNGSVLIANPVPSEFEVPFAVMDVFIKDSLKQAEVNRISGKELTPFLLKSIAEKSGGISLESNIELVKNNARMGARISAYI